MDQFFKHLKFNAVLVNRNKNEFVHFKIIIIVTVPTMEQSFWRGLKFIAPFWSSTHLFPRH